MVVESLLTVAAAGTAASIIGSVITFITQYVKKRYAKHHESEPRPISLTVTLSDGTVVNVDKLDSEQADAIVKDIDDIQKARGM